MDPVPILDDAQLKDRQVHVYPVARLFSNETQAENPIRVLRRRGEHSSSLCAARLCIADCPQTLPTNYKDAIKRMLRLDERESLSVQSGIVLTRR